MKTVLRWLQTFKPVHMPLSMQERLRACCGAGIGVFLTGMVSHLLISSSIGLPWMIAPMAASAVLLFAMPASPLAQPWPVVGGNTVSAVVGVTCAYWFSDPIFASAMATSGAVAAMLALRCLHPPGAAIALVAVLGGPLFQAEGYRFALAPVALNSLLLLTVAIVFNNATRHRYPHQAQPNHNNTHRTADARPTDRVGFTPADLDAVLKQYNEVLDVGRDDLEHLFLATEMHAYRRRFGEITCADIMSRDLVTVQFGTPLEQAWHLLRKHRIKALPVLDDARHVIGIVTLVDFMKHANLDLYKGFADRIKRFIRISTVPLAGKPEVVGQIMTAQVRTISAEMHIVELVPLLSDLGLHHIPIVDKDMRLAGMVTQSDLIAALYRGRVADMSAAA